MSSYHQTVVVELGSSRIKIGFAGESRPRRVLHGDVWDSDDGCSWCVPVNDGIGARPCTWRNFFHYFSMNNSRSSVASKFSSEYEWEQTLYSLFSHILTSVLFVQRPSRHRILILMNDVNPPRNFREALVRVLLNYLNVGRVLVVNGGGFASISYLLEGFPSSIDVSRPAARLLVDIGSYEARVSVLVTGSSILTETNHFIMAGYHSFLRQVLNNYQDQQQETSVSDACAKVTTLQDANSIVLAWLSVCHESTDVTTMSIHLPSNSSQSPAQLSISPLQEAFRQVYLDYTNPSSLVFAMLSSLVACPIDYRRVALQNVVLLGGGSSALRCFNYTNCDHSKEKSGSKFGNALIMAALDACGVNNDSILEISDEKKEADSVVISSISKHRFKCLRAPVLGRVDERGELKGGMAVMYPDPFAADVASWIGGSIMGTLDLKNEDWLFKICDSDNFDAKAS